MEWALWVGILLFLSSISIGMLNIYLGLKASEKAEKEQANAEFVFKRGPRAS